MDLKLAGADFTFPLLAHDKALALISLLELPGIDIGLFEDRSHLQPSQMFLDVNGNARELKSKMDDNNLVPADIFLQAAGDFVSMASNHPAPKVREKARAWYLDSLEFVQICDGGHTTGLPGVYYEEESTQMSYGRACEEMAWRCEKAKEAGIVFAIEPHIGSIVPDPESAAQLVADVPGLALTLDYTHFTKIGMPDERVEPLIAHATHFHARGAAEGFLQASYKNNTIDYGRVYDEMVRTKYPGYVGLEYIWIDWENCNEVDNVAEVIQLRDLFWEKAGKLR